MAIGAVPARPAAHARPPGCAADVGPDRARPVAGIDERGHVDALVLALTRVEGGEPRRVDRQQRAVDLGACRPPRDRGTRPRPPAASRRARHTPCIPGPRRRCPSPRPRHGGGRAGRRARRPAPRRARRSRRRRAPSRPRDHGALAVAHQRDRQHPRRSRARRPVRPRDELRVALRRAERDRRRPRPPGSSSAYRRPRPAGRDARRGSGSTTCAGASSHSAPVISRVQAIGESTPTMSGLLAA